jgi:hypothetical protein
MTCVVFDQRLEHEGAPYRDGRKIFLRTELIFEEQATTQDPRIGALFSKACYLTGESVFAPELTRWADAYYDRVAAAHWQGLGERGEREPFMHKEFRGVHFVANGHDFWFSQELSLAHCAAITLLDYFNCVIGKTGFRAQCKSDVIFPDARDAGAVPAFLRARPSVSPWRELDKDAFFPPAEETDEAMCCPFHIMSFDPARHDEIVDVYEQAQAFARANLAPAPILMMGSEIFLDESKFVIDGDKIHVVGDRAIAPVNFAACWNYGGSPPDWIGVDVKVGVVHALVPPILFHQREGCWHLSFDFFRNAWMVREQQAIIPIPKIRYPREGEEGDGDTPFAEARPFTRALPRTLLGKSTVWWSREKLPAIADAFALEDEDEEDADDDE